jgi:hypothetical protein
MSRCHSLVLLRDHRRSDAGEPAGLRVPGLVGTVLRVRPELLLRAARHRRKLRVQVHDNLRHLGLDVLDVVIELPASAVARLNAIGG